MKKLRYTVKGMSCAVCVAHVERTAASVCGDGSALVSLLTNSLTVTVPDDTDEAALFITLKKALKNAGYTLLRPTDSNSGKNAGQEDYRRARRTLIASLIITAALMYVSMGHMLSLPLPKFITDDAVVFSLLQIALTLPVLILNRKFFKNGFFALINRSPNMDSLIALGSSAAFIYGIFAVVMIFISTSRGDLDALHSYRHDLYFESAAMILTLVSLGKALEGRARGAAADAIGKLARMLPDKVTVRREGAWVELPISEISVDDEIMIKAGEIIPTDAVIIEGECAVDESMLSGESIPIEKTIGDKINAACTVAAGYAIARTEKVGTDTAHSKIIALLEDAAASKAPIARVADKISAIFVPTVMLISLITAVIWGIIGGAEAAFRYAISVLVISCPCALGLATPTAVMVGTALGAEHGILIKSAAALEALGSVKYFMTDKTGTLTEGKPKLTDIISADGVSENELLCAAYTAENLSAHPLATPICETAREREIEPYKAENFKSFTGKGIIAYTNSGSIAVGRPDFLISFGFEGAGCEFILNSIEKLENAGKTAVAVGFDGRVIGVLGIADAPREDSARAVRALKNMGITTVMLTGDNEKAARAIGENCGVDEVYAALLPEDKEKIIREHRERGLSAMAGDGINDAPALASADIGIAIGAGSEVAIDSADVVLTRNSIVDATIAIKLSRATMRTIKENLFWALIYNSICIPIAAGAFAAFGVSISPMIASAAMSVSSICVVLNSIRLKRKRI